MMNPETPAPPKEYAFYLFCAACGAITLSTYLWTLTGVVASCCLFAIAGFKWLGENN